ncbi:hypothetical protein ACFFWC_21535 [Plantactinospora siamensis]|uniref:Uncharacterized protein n=1 Tax=Plantactinospora siamensis TaxID=555372 RepID=A0ABV6P5H7_9ACTN
MTTLAVLGADARQRAGFLWTEAHALVVAGVAGGIATGALARLRTHQNSSTVSSTRRRRTR